MHCKNPVTILRNGCFLVLALLLASLIPERAVAQSFDLGGFVKSEYLYDTRQVVAAREGEFHLFPAPESEATDTDNFGAFMFFSRLSLGITELPEAFGAETRGYFEADFFGAGDPTVSNFRLRRAFVNLDWETHEVLFGQEWSPLFTLAAFPQTVATTTGAPFQPFARQPQIRLTLKPGNLRLIGVAAWQRDAFSDIAFDGVSGVEQQQHAAIPAWHGHVQYALDGGGTVGGGAYFKALRPIITEDRFYTGAVQGYATLPAGPATVRAKATYGADLSDHLMTGGYVYSEAENEFYPLDLFSTWLDIDGAGAVAPGIFVGYLTNLGSADEVGAGVTAAARAPNIDVLWRIAPRLAFNSGPVRLAFELEATTASYAESLDENYAPAGDTNAVTNLRGNFSVFLFF